MWWNLIGRSHDEIEQARAEWNARGATRFGEVDHYPTAERLDAPPLPNLRLKSRGRSADASLLRRRGSVRR